MDLIRVLIPWNLIRGTLFALITANALLLTAEAQFIQQGSKLSGTDAVGQSRQGVAVALSSDGSTVIVGGSGDFSGLSGSAWVYTRSGSLWIQQGPKLVGTGAAGPDPKQGSSVALSADGNTAIIGAPGDNNYSGATWVFTRSSGSWHQQGGKLVGTGAEGPAQQGLSVALSADGNTAIVGGPFDNNAVGAAWVFTRSGTTWRQQGGKLVGSGAAGNASQGRVALSADGNTAIIAGPNDANAGAVWVFTRVGGAWSQRGDKIVGPGVNTGFGASVALSSDGQTFIAGAPYAGGAWVFTQTSGAWTQQGGKLVGSTAPGLAGRQGSSVALSGDGNTAVTGGPLGSGAAWVFERVGNTFNQVGDPLVGSGAAGIPGEGASVGISADGSTVAVGGPGDAGRPGDVGFAGATWMYARSSSPFIATDGVVNGASYLPGIAPGAWITVKGWNLSATTRTWQATDFSGNNLPTQLDGVQVTVNGKPAYVYYVSPTQLNVLAPDDATTGAVPVQVINTAGLSKMVTASESLTSPALFAVYEPTGTYVAAVRPDGTYLGPDMPVKPGDTILLYGTGFGPTTPPQPVGQLVTPAPLAGQATVQIGGVAASTSFSGLVSPGLYQFNVVVPDIPDGDRPVSAAIGSAVSQPNMLLTIKR